MANTKQASTKRVKMAERAQMQMDLHFPDAPAVELWHRKTNDGFITIPRTLPIVMQAIDHVSDGKAAGHVLFCLWARSPDHPFLTIENQSTYAAEAGFTGERAVDTWRKRMKVLRDLNFIVAKKGPSGDFHYVLLLNPNGAVEWLRKKGRVNDLVYSRFLDRVTEIGAFGEIEAIHAHWAAIEEAERAKAGEATPTETGEKSE